MNLKSFLKKFDLFGVYFSFKYKNEETYSTPLGALVCFLFYILFLIVFIKNIIPFYRKENFSISFYQ